MPSTDRFEKIYGAVTDDLRAYVEEEYAAGRMSQFERRWFTQGLIMLGAYVYRGMVRALDANLTEGQRFA